MIKKKSAKKNIIITGALGQDGIILSKMLNSKRYKVIGLIQRSPTIKVKNVIYNKIDLNNFKKLFVFIKKFDPVTLIHFGSKNPSFEENKQKKKIFYKQNLKVTKNLIDCFTHFKNSKLIIIGSSQMYKNSDKKITIDTNFRNSSPYTRFRIDSFKYMMKKKITYNSNMVMAILFNHDSIFRNKKFLIPRLVKIVKNKNFNQIQKIYDENISGDFSHADDICRGLLKLINTKKNPNKLIFSSNKRFHINDIINYLLKINRINKKFIKKHNKQNQASIGDNSYTKKLLNWNLKKNIFIAVKELNMSI